MDVGDRSRGRSSPEVDRESLQLVDEPRRRVRGLEVSRGLRQEESGPESVVTSGTQSERVHGDGFADEDE